MSELNKMKLNTVEPRLTDEDIDDIMCSALEGGVTYWCERAEVVGDYLGEFASEQISRGGELKLYDEEEEAELVLDRNKFITGFMKWYAEGGDWYKAVQSDGSVDCGLIDSCRADAIVQYALFGDIIYG